MRPSGGSWLCKNFWDHYEFTGDRQALAKNYPLMAGAARFFLDALVEEPTHGWLVTCPSSSPENAHSPDVSICAGPTMDMQIIRDLFSQVVKSSEILGIDADLRKCVCSALERLAPSQIGAHGQLQEWLSDWDARAPEQDHRHVSHLYGLYPSSQINQRDTPGLVSAVRKSLEIRGDDSTGWAEAWRINLWARLLDGDHACKLIRSLLSPTHTAPNMFDLHPPFQIDGNFGGSAGIMEMLLQSQNGELHLLPALPSTWPWGRVRGIRARGGFEIDMDWVDGRLSEATIRSHRGNPCVVRYADNVTELAIEAGSTATYHLAWAANGS